MTPGVLRWPVLDSWWPAAPATVVYHGSAPATSVAVAGEDAGQFTVRADGCTGQPPPCTVEVGFAPTAPGARRARLEIVDTAGVRHAVTLEGFLHGGTTRADIEVLAGDVAAPPGDRGLHAYAPADARSRGSSTRRTRSCRCSSRTTTTTTSGGTSASTREAGRSCSRARATPTRRGTRTVPAPASPSPAARRGATRPRARSPSTRSATCRTAGCGRSTRASSAAATHDQRPAARGTWRFRAGDDVPLPAWMVPGTAAADRGAAGAGPAHGVDRAACPRSPCRGSAARRDRRAAPRLAAEGLPRRPRPPASGSARSAPTSCAAPARRPHPRPGGQRPHHARAGSGLRARRPGQRPARRRARPRPPRLRPGSPGPRRRRPRRPRPQLRGTRAIRYSSRSDIVLPERFRPHSGWLASPS